MKRLARGAASGLAVLLAVAAVPSAARADDGDPEILPTFRGMFGGAFHLGDKPLVRFTTDVDAGMFAILGRMQILVGGELGYTYDSVGLDAFNLAAVLGYGRANLAYVTFQPRLLLGTIDEDVAVGMRNGIGGHFLTDFVDLELGHQFVWSDGRLKQAITATAGINPAAILYLLVTD